MEIQQEIQMDYRRARFRRFCRVVLLFVIVLILSVPAFLYFRIQTGSHLALREAKNIRLAFELLSVEYYGSGRSVYSPECRDGLTEEVKQRVLETTEKKGNIRILSYDKKTRAVRAFVYETDQYQVTYSIDKDEVVHWDVKYLLPVETLSGAAK